MTLRFRIAVTLGLVGALAVTIAGVVSYATTASRLSSSVDSSLEQAIALLVRELPPPVHPGAPAGAPGGPAPNSRPGRPPRTPPPPDLLNFVIEQRVDQAGAVVSDSNSITLPVTTEVRTLAAQGGSEILETVVADGDPYRVITVAVPGGGAIELGQDVRENDELLDSLRERFLLIGALVIVASAISGWLLSMRMTRSLRRLSLAAEEVGRSGAITAPIETSGRDEIGRLGRSFVAMLSALTQSRHQQQRLIEDASHELRTPLTSLRANIALLHRYQDLPAARSERIFSDLDSEIVELSSLVAELIELGTDRYAEEPVVTVRIDELAEAGAARTRARSGRAVHVDATAWSFDAQRGAFERVIGNLLDNAVKFSPEGRVIEVTVVPGRLAVRDFGDGLAEGDGAQIFERFYRSAMARSLPGSGLGLAIVKDVVERFGGSVSAENAPGGGARIGFTLPT